MRKHIAGTLILMALMFGIATFLSPEEQRLKPSSYDQKTAQSMLDERLALQRASRAYSRSVAASASTTTTDTTAVVSTTHTHPSRPPVTTVPKKATVSRTPNREISGGDVWAKLAQCESGGNTTATSSNGTYLGAFQFSRATWASVGGPGDPRDHDYGTQLKYAQILQARSGWGQWPSCSKRLGLR